ASGLVVAQNEKPDLIITDILMPGTDGFEFTRRVRADPVIRKTPVIFYTSTYRVSEANALATECGVHTVLQKPSEAEVILEAVQKELGWALPKPVGVPAAAPLHLHDTPFDEQINVYVEDMLAVRRDIERVDRKISTLTDLSAAITDASTKFSARF